MPSQYGLRYFLQNFVVKRFGLIFGHPYRFNGAKIRLVRQECEMTYEAFDLKRFDFFVWENNDLENIFLAIFLSKMTGSSNLNFSFILFKFHLENLINLEWLNNRIPFLYKFKFFFIMALVELLFASLKIAFHNYCSGILIAECLWKKAMLKTDNVTRAIVYALTYFVLMFSLTL